MQLTTHMKECIRQHGHDRLELEWRLGHRHDRFRPGVGAAAWERLKNALDASPAFSKTFAETTEKMGKMDGIKCICPRDAPPTWMRKQRLADVDEDLPGHPWSVRASVSLEQPMGRAALSQYERHKRRWSYAHRCWRVDLTSVVSNLPAHQDDDRESFEVEIELADQDVLYERPVDHIVEWGWQMVSEICDLMRG